MQNVVIDKPYEFVPPDKGTLWAQVLVRLFLRWHLRAQYGVESLELIGVEKLKASVAAGHGILLAPNHCRPCDPMVLFPLGISVGSPIHIMASWHLFMQGAIQRWTLKRVGVFSVYREGLDREALKCAIQILAEARRPLVLFPEGVISRSNDKLNDLMDGTVFIARNAAKQRAEQTPAGRVVLHPIAIRYFFQGDLPRTIEPALDDLERRLSWQPRTGLPIKDRIAATGAALLTLKELEYFGEPQPGSIAERIQRLIDRLLTPLEAEWLKGVRDASVVTRVKTLRAAILPDLVADRVDEAERVRRWRQLGDLYLAQQVSGYPPQYVADPTPERLIETVERFEEDLTDKARVHRPLHAVIEVGEAIEVPPGRDRSGAGDGIMTRVRADLERMLEGLRARRPTSSTL